MRWKDHIIDKQEQEANELLKHKDSPEPTEAEQVDIDLFNFNHACDQIDVTKPDTVWNALVDMTRQDIERLKGDQ